LRGFDLDYDTRTHQFFGYLCECSDEIFGDTGFSSGTFAGDLAEFDDEYFFLDFCHGLLFSPYGFCHAHDTGHCHFQHQTITLIIMIKKEIVMHVLKVRGPVQPPPERIAEPPMISAGQEKLAQPLAGHGIQLPISEICSQAVPGMLQQYGVPGQRDLGLGILVTAVWHVRRQDVYDVLGMIGVEIHPIMMQHALVGHRDLVYEIKRTPQEFQIRVADGAE
jgi:hypothetical protein